MKLLNVLAVAVTGFLFAQNTPLQNKFKIEAGMQGINAGYEMPLSSKFLLDLNAGVGGAVHVYKNGSNSTSIKYVVAENDNFYASPFVRAQIRYYLNSDQREARGHSLANNSGSFIGFQSKAVFNKNFDNALVSDVHFGQQLPLGSHIIFRYHAGVGVGVNLNSGAAMPYPAIGASFGYAF